MSKSSLITVLALIASVSAKPYIYRYGTVPQAAYTAADLYNPAAVAPLTAAVAPLPAAAVAPLPAAYSTPAVAPLPAYSTAYSAAYAPLSGAYAPLSGAYSAPLTLPALSAYGSTYSVEELAALYNPASYYASPYSYLYKR